MIGVSSAGRSPVGERVTGTQKPLAFLCHPYHRGGVTRWMVDAASNWVERGHDCWFVTPRPRRAFLNGAHRPAMVAMIEALPHFSRPRLIAPLVGPEFEFGTTGYRARTYARALQEWVQPGVPVIVSDDPSTWLAVALLDGRNPLIGVLHADDAAYYALATRFQRTAAALVAVSRRVHLRARVAALGSHARAEVIPCGIVLPPPAESRNDASGTVRLVWVGRISEAQKRVSDLVGIAQALVADGLPFVLDILGDGEDAQSLRADVERAGLTSRVRFHGWLPSDGVLKTLGRSDVLLLPSNFEGMPVAAMEALACGCAVVASDTSGLEEYADEPAARDALWIYPRGDVRKASIAVTAAARVATERRRTAARHFAGEEFAIDVCMDRYDAMLAHLPPVPVTRVAVRAWHPGDFGSSLLANLRQVSAWSRIRLASFVRGSRPSAVPSNA